MSGIWSAVTGFFADSLAFLHDGFQAIGFGSASWGWAIIALTLITRIAMLPLNIKQTRSMRHMQEIAPRVKAIQKKYKADRELMRTNPEKYRMLKQKANEETMALYKEEGVNPAGGCLPLIAQMPIFLALFSVLRSKENLELVTAPFYFFTDHVGQVNLGTAEAPEMITGGLGSATSSAGWPGWLLIVLMAGTMFVTQRQMMARNAASADDAQAQQQKIMLYVMPVFLAVISFSLPLGVLLYWVTTNLWQMVQQYIMFRDLQANGTGALAEAARAHSNRGKGAGRPKAGAPSDDTSSSLKERAPKAKRSSSDRGPAKAGGGSPRPDHKARKEPVADETPVTTAPVHNPPGANKKRKKRHLPGAN